MSPKSEIENKRAPFSFATMCTEIYVATQPLGIPCFFFKPEDRLSVGGDDKVMGSKLREPIIIFSPRRWICSLPRCRLMNVLALRLFACYCLCPLSCCWKEEEL
jgi:hypothetical protein